MKKNYEISRIFSENGLPEARMVCGCKISYMKMVPDNEVYFNANIVNQDGEKIWYGDLDLTKDTKALQEISKVLGELYVLSEMDGRFENEEKLTDHQYLKQKSKKIINEYSNTGFLY